MNIPSARGTEWRGRRGDGSVFRYAENFPDFSKAEEKPPVIDTKPKCSECEFRSDCKAEGTIRGSFECQGKLENKN